MRLLACLAAAAAVFAAPALAQSSDWRSVDPNNLLVIDTTRGRILIEMVPEAAPGHVERMRVLARQGLTLRQTVESDETALPFNLARAGVGLALVPEELALAASERQELVIWPHARLTAQLAFVYALAAEHEPALVAVLSALRSVWGRSA